MALRDLILQLTERKSGNALTEVATELDGLARGVDTNTKHMKEMEDGTKSLEGEIAKTTDRIKDLRLQVAKTGDESLFGDIRKEEARLRNLNKTLEGLTPELEKAQRAGLAQARSMETATQTAARLRQEILKTTNHIKAMRLEFAKTKDQSVLGDIHKAESDLRELKKTLEAVGSSGATAGTSFFSTFAGAFKDLPVGPMLIGGLVAAVVAALPLIGGIVAGAVTGLAGVGGIAGGIFAASKDERVRSAASAFGNTLSSEFFSSGDAFITPIVRSLGILQESFQGLDLQGSFARAAPYVTVLAQGIGDLATKFMPGFNKALDRAGPFIRATAVGLGEIGNALGGFLDDSSRSKGALQGLELGFNLISGTIAATGKIIEWLSDRLHDMNVGVENVSDFFTQLTDAIGLPVAGLHNFTNGMHEFNEQTPKAGHFIDTFGDSLHRASQQVAHMDEAMKTMNAEFDEWINKSLGVSNAAIAVAQDFADLGQSGAKGWKLNTQAGRDHQKMVNDTIADLQRQRDAAIAAGDGSKASIDAANKSYQDQLDNLKKIALGLGATKAEVDALAGDYNVNVYYKLHSEGSAPPGLAAEIQSVVKKRAMGGPVMAGQPYIVGENHPELFVPSTNGYIQPSVPTGGGGGSSPTVVISFAPTGNSLFDALLKELRKYIRTQGGDVQVALTG